MADNFDEFEFKPLTEGLGFHKKSAKSVSANANSIVDTRARNSSETIGFEDIAQMGFVEPEKPTKSNPFLNSPLPRENQYTVPKFQQKKFAEASAESKTESKTNAPEIPGPGIINPLRKPEVSNKSETTRMGITDFLKQKRPFDFDDVQLLPTTSHIGSYLFDLITTIGIAALFAMALMLASDIDVFKVSTTLAFDTGMQIGTGLLLVSVLQLYLVLSRSFFGSTLGEWVFDIQLDKPNEQSQVIYPVKVFWRGTLVILTGLVVLPLCSLILGRDLAARAGGLQLYKK